MLSNLTKYVKDYFTKTKKIIRRTTIIATPTQSIVRLLPLLGADGGWLAGGGVEVDESGAGAGLGAGGVSAGAGGGAVGVGVGVPEGSITFPLLLLIFYHASLRDIQAKC